MDYTPTRKILWSILSGLLLTASFPPGKLEWLAWFALVPLFKSLENESPSGAFKLGFVTGLAHYLTLIYWIILVLGAYGGLNIIVSFGVLVLLCLYLSIYPGLFSVLFHHFHGSRFQVLLIASAWVSLEFARAKLLTGFPWCLLGYSQYGHPLLIQVADSVGVYGLSFLILAVNALLYLLFLDGHSQHKKRLFGFELLVVASLFIFTIAYGSYRFSEYSVKTGEKRSVRVAVIQGNIDQSIKWNPVYQKKTIDIYLRLSRSIYKYGPDLIVWPETAVPFFFQDPNELTERVIGIPMESGAQLIFGSPAYRREGGGVRYYNRAYHITPRGLVTGFYDKVHLVPFGEYVPLKRFLRFVHRLVPAAGDFASGREGTPLSLPDLPTGLLICYESIFPELSRHLVMKDAKILVNLTNDAWFGMSSAPYQHLIMCLFRAVENRRPLIRAANTGFSAFIDRMGRITRVGDLFCEEVLIGDVAIGNEQLTFYSRYGDIFVYLLIFICLIHFLNELCYHRFKKR